MKIENTDTFNAVVANIMNKEIKILSQGTISSCLISSDVISGKSELCIGDWIEVRDIGNSQCRALNILPRKSAIYRGNRRSPGAEILIAANAQLLLAIVTANYLLNQAGYLEAAIIAAKRANIEVGIFISKRDLVNDHTQSLLQSKIELYRPYASFIFAGSSNDYHSDLIKAVKGKTVLVVGDRGCGKTTLIDRHLSEQPETKICNNKAASTHTSVLKTGYGETLWIDTPGFRDFALQHITEEERNAVFHEIAKLAVNCHFRNCSHAYEDECQVLDALRKKLIKRERYDIYQKMVNIKTSLNHAPKVDYRHSASDESFTCKVCGEPVVPEGAGSRHRNHCPECLSSLHVDEEPGDRASLCKGIMEPISIWVRKGGEWAIVHRCRACGALSSNRIAADDNTALLMSIAVKPLAITPFPLYRLNETVKTNV